MSQSAIAFTLPIGFVDEAENLHRTGTMRPATAGDELAIQGSDKVAFNARYRDLELLSRVITTLGNKTAIDVMDIENLYEADFLYLQLLYQSINGDQAQAARINCPHCGNSHQLSLPHLFAGMVFRSPDGEEPAVAPAHVETVE